MFNKFNKTKNIKNKKSLIISITIIFIIITISTTTLLLIAVTNQNVTTNTKALEKEQKNYSYLMKDVNGKINIFEKNNTTPTIILEKPTIFLPEFDRKILSEGIYLSNKKELSNLIEDYDD